MLIQKEKSFAGPKKMIKEVKAAFKDSYLILSQIYDFNPRLHIVIHKDTDDNRIGRY